MKNNSDGKKQIKEFEIKTKETFVNKTFRLPEEFVSEMAQVAQEKKISLNELVYQCCQYALANMKKD